MVNLVGLEKAIEKMEKFMLEFRASRASPLITFPTDNLNTEPTPRLHPTPVQDSAHIKAELIGQRQEDVKTLPSSPPPPQPLPLAVQQPIHVLVLVPLPSPTSPPTPATLPTSAMVTATLPSSSPDMPHFQPPFLPLLWRLVPAAAANHAKLMVPSTLPTIAMVTAPLLSTNSNIWQNQSHFFSLRQCLVSAAAHLFTPTGFSFPGSLFSSASALFSYLVMLRSLHIVGHLLWFDTLATIQKHEFEPPPNKVIGFNFHLRLEGKAVLRVRQLIRIGIWGFGNDLEERFGLSINLHQQGKQLEVEKEV